MSWINSIRKDLKELKSTRKELREFGMLVGAVMVALSIFVFKEFLIPGVVIGLLLITLGLTKPKYLKNSYYVWMMIALVIGWFVTRFVLFIVFVFGILTIKILLRLTNKQLLDMKINKRTKTYWIYRQPSGKYDSMLDKQF